MGKTPATIKKSLMYVVAGIATVKFAQEIPAIIRYFKMKRL